MNDSFLYTLLNGDDWTICRKLKKDFNISFNIHDNGRNYISFELIKYFPNGDVKSLDGEIKIKRRDDSNDVIFQPSTFIQLIFWKNPDSYSSYNNELSYETSVYEFGKIANNVFNNKNR